MSDAEDKGKEWEKNARRKELRPPPSRAGEAGPPPCDSGYLHRGPAGEGEEEEEEEEEGGGEGG